MNAIAHHPERIALIQNLVCRHAGALEIGTTRLSVRDWQPIETALCDCPWCSITMESQAARFAPLMLDELVVGRGWVPPCAVFRFEGVDGQAIATLRIWIDRPRVLVEPGLEGKNYVEAIANAFIRSFI